MGRKWGKRSNPIPPVHPELDRRLARLNTLAEGKLSGAVVGYRDAKLIGVGPTLTLAPDGGGFGVTLAIQAGQFVHGVRLTDDEAVDLVLDLCDTLSIHPDDLVNLRKDK